MRRASLVLALLLVPALAGCIGDVRQQRTNLHLFLDVSDDSIIDRFAALEVIVTHVAFKPNTTGAEPTTLSIVRHVDLVPVADGGPYKLLEAKIPYYVYDRISLGVNVTNALLLDGTPVTVEVPRDNIYCIGGGPPCAPKAPFRTRLGGDVAYDFVIAPMEDEAGYFLQSRPVESGARRA